MHANRQSALGECVNNGLVHYPSINNKRVHKVIGIFQFRNWFSFFFMFFPFRSTFSTSPAFRRWITGTHIILIESDKQLDWNAPANGQTMNERQGRNRAGESKRGRQREEIDFDKQLLASSPMEIYSIWRRRFALNFNISIIFSALMPLNGCSLTATKLECLFIFFAIGLRSKRHWKEKVSRML